MSFSRCLLSSTLLAGAVFSAATLPLTALGSKSVTIQLEEQPVFIGQVKEMAGPYLGLATAISLGAGIVSLATAGWQQSSRKMSQTEEQMSSLKQQLQENKALIESLKYSDARLEASGLEYFLDDPQPVVAPVNASVQYTPAEYTVMRSATTEPQLAADFDAPAQSASEPVSQQTKVQAATAMASAQAFMGFARPTATAEAEAIAADQTENSTQLDELLNHLKQVMSQIEQLSVVQTAPQDRNEVAWQQHKLAS